MSSSNSFDIPEGAIPGSIVIHAPPSLRKVLGVKKPKKSHKGHHEPSKEEAFSDELQKIAMDAGGATTLLKIALVLGFISKVYDHAVSSD